MLFRIILQQGDRVGAIAGAIGGFCGLAIGIVVLIGMWRVYTKAGKPGWATLIPIYQLLVLMEIVGRPGWWVLLMLVPFVNVIIGILVMIDLAKSFGKGTGYGLGLIFLAPIFLIHLGFSDARYQGPAAATL